MIEVNFNSQLFDSSLNYYCLDVSGHSGYADKGQDIVCAGASAIMTALARQLDKMNEEKPFNLYDIAGTEGHAHAEAKANRAGLKEVFDMAVRGLRAIEAEYPDYIHVVGVIGDMRKDKVSPKDNEGQIDIFDYGLILNQSERKKKKEGGSVLNQT